MNRALIGVCVLVLGACGDDDVDPADGGMDANRVDSAVDSSVDAAFDAAVDTAQDALAPDGGPGLGEPVLENVGEAFGCCGNQVGLRAGSDGVLRMFGINDRGGARDLWFATRDDGVWTEEDTMLSATADPTAFAIGPDDAPHALTTVRTMGGSAVSLNYVRLEGDTWTATLVADDAQIGTLFTHFDIAVDSSGGVHIVYFDTVLLAPRYGRWNGSAFDLETIETPSDGDQSGEFARIGIAADGTVHVSYLAIVSDTAVLRHATGVGAWVVSDVPGTAAGVHGTLMVDSAGNPHIVSSSLVSSRARGIYWSRLESGSWTETELAPDTTAVVDMNAVLGAGEPHVAFSNSVSGFGWWNYIYPNGSGFTTFEGRPDGAPGDPPESIAIDLDASGAPYILIPNVFISFE